MKRGRDAAAGRAGTAVRAGAMGGKAVDRAQALRTRRSAIDGRVRRPGAGWGMAVPVRRERRAGMAIMPLPS
ncbi:hypothetical protein G432_08335 [Sphingomonas sp. MM-1]|nr:hypothetical protein G432_08335 [Sphingomonas sp. MM-1]